MKKNRIALIVTEICLLALAVFLITKIYEQKTVEKRVAVIVPNSGNEKWDFVLKGMKDAASANDIHLIICNTGDIESAQAEAELIREQKDNDIDGFIIYPTHGDDTEEILDDECGVFPYLLIVQDTYLSENENVVIAPDYYETGYSLGQQILKDDTHNLKGKIIGIVAGPEDSDQTQKCEAGLQAAIREAEGTISWIYHSQPESHFMEDEAKLSDVDYLVVLAREMLDDIAEEERADGTKIYGFGNSMESIALLDKGKIETLSITDHYALGYESVTEIAQKLKNSFYQMKSHEITTRLVSQDELTMQDIERFIYSYE